MVYYPGFQEESLFGKLHRSGHMLDQAVQVIFLPGPILKDKVFGGFLNKLKNQDCYPRLARQGLDHKLVNAFFIDQSLQVFSGAQGIAFDVTAKLGMKHSVEFGHRDLPLAKIAVKQKFISQHWRPGAGVKGAAQFFFCVIHPEIGTDMFFGNPQLAKFKGAVFHRR